MKNSKLSIIIFAVIIIGVGVGVFLLTRNNGDKGNSGKKDNPTSIRNVSISTSDLVIEEGSTKDFNISIKNAVGRVDLSFNDNDVASVEENTMWLESLSDKEIKETVSVTGKKAGTTQLVIKLADVATFDTEEQLTGSLIVNVTVK